MEQSESEMVWRPAHPRFSFSSLPSHRVKVAVLVFTPCRWGLLLGKQAGQGGKVAGLGGVVEGAVKKRKGNWWQR